MQKGWKIFRELAGNRQELVGERSYVNDLPPSIVLRPREKRFKEIGAIPSRAQRPRLEVRPSLQLGELHRYFKELVEVLIMNAGHLRQREALIKLDTSRLPCVRDPLIVPRTWSANHGPPRMGHI